MQPFQLFSHLWCSDTLRDSVIVLGGSVLSSLLGFVFVSVVARSMGPVEFGVFSTMINYVVFMAAVVDMGISNSLVRFVQSSSSLAKQRIWLSTGLAVVVGGALGFGLLATGLYQVLLQQLWNHQSGYSLYIWLTIVVITLNIFSLSLFQSLRRFWIRAMVDTVFSVVRLVMVGLLLVVGGITLGWSMGSIIIGYSVALVVGWGLARNLLGWSAIRPKKIPTLLRFSGWIGGVNLFANLYGKLDVLMLAWLSSAYTTGIYAAASRFILIFPLVVTSLSSVVAPRFSQFTRHADLRAYVRHSLWLCILVSGGMLLLIILARPIILIPYSESFAETIPIFQWLVLANIPLVLSIPATNAIIYFFKKPQYITAIAALQLIGLVSLNWIWIPRHGGYGPVYSLLAMNLLGLAVLYSLYYGMRKVVYV